MAFPGPIWLAHPLSYIFGLVVGVGIGQYLLGYKANYAEYYDAKRENRKDK